MLRSAALSDKSSIKKIMENDFALIVADQSFPHQNYLAAEKCPESSFISKIKDATDTLHNNNPAQGLWYAAKMEKVKGSSFICSAEINKKHRVQLITRHNSESNKVIVFMVEDDINHKYEIRKIEARYKAKWGYPCGSDEHWNAIFEAIKNKNYLLLNQPSKPPAPAAQVVTLHAVQPTTLQENTPAAINIPKPVETKDPHDDGLKPEPTTLAKQAADAVQVQGEENGSDVETGVKPQKTQCETDSEEEVPSKKKKKKKKKNVSPDEIMSLFNFLQENVQKENFHDMLCDLLKKHFSLEIIRGLLNLGMSPNIADKDGYSLLTIARREDNVPLVKLLLDRGACLTEQYNHHDGSQKVIINLLAALMAQSNPEIIRALVQKTKEKGELDKLLLPYLPAMTYLHYAVIFKNVEGVRALVEAGASCEMTDSMYQLTPLALAQSILSGQGNGFLLATVIKKYRNEHVATAIEELMLHDNLVLEAREPEQKPASNEAEDVSIALRLIVKLLTSRKAERVSANASAMFGKAPQPKEKEKTKLTTLASDAHASMQDLKALFNKSSQGLDAELTNKLFNKSEKYAHDGTLTLLDVMGMNPNTCNSKGASLLDYAISMKFTTVVTLLLDRGANLIYPVSAKGTTRNVVEDILRNTNINRDILKLIIQRMNKDGVLDTMEMPGDSSPLLWAIACKNTAAVEELCSAGANTDIVLADGTNALGFAAKRTKDHPECKPMLQALLTATKKRQEANAGRFSQTKHSVPAYSASKFARS